ncbi:unnamed protein product [Urochloa humidicola]
MEDAYGRTNAAVTSCWGRLGLAPLWRRLRRMSWTRRRYRTYVLGAGAGAGGLNYDPHSYAENFDDGKVCESEPDFLTRYAAARRAGLQGPVAWPVVNS